MDINEFFIKNVIYPGMEVIKGNKIRSNMHMLENTQRLTKDEIRALQGEKLKKLLLTCIEYVPAYYAYKDFADAIRENPFEALKSFPILSKQEFKKNSDKYISTQVNRADLIPNRTGGSTGEPVKFFMDRYTVEYYEAARWRGLSWWDIDMGDRSVMIWGSPIELNQMKHRIYTMKERILKNRISIPAYDLNPESIDNYINTINHFKPVYLYGYASALYIFAKLLSKSNTKLKINLKAVVSTSESLFDFQREAIETAFRCNVVNEYGARDAGILAYECPHKKMHVCAENVHLETVDIETKEPVGYNKSGLVLSTDLNNFSMPRLRYILGDVAKLSDSTCGCEISLPLLDDIEGREDAVFVSLNGNLIHGHYFNHIARTLEGIKQFQIIQHNRNDVSLIIVKEDSYTDHDLEAFKSGIISAMGNVLINIKFSEKIPESSSGKIRYTIRKFNIM